MNNDIRKTLEALKDGKITVDEAMLAIRKEPFEDLGYAKVDLHRAVRQGAAEVIYGASKTPDQMIGIINSMRSNGVKTILVTRLAKEAAEMIAKSVEISYDPVSKIGIVGKMPAPDGIGKIVVATGGTSDVPIAEEAALTAEAHGNEVVRLYDVGVAGLHRILSHVDELMEAKAVVAIAGMEGAGKRHRRSRELSGHSSSNKCRLRGIIWRSIGFTRDVKFLCKRGIRSEHR